MARVRGRDLRGVLRIPLRFNWLLLVAVLLRLAISLLGPRLGYRAGGAFNLVYVVALLGWVILNARVAGFPVVAVGVVMNVAVLALNGGHMPVLLDLTRPDDYEVARRYYATGQDVVHGVMQCRPGGLLLACPGQPLWFLADVIQFPFPGIGRELSSPGDLVIALGVGLAAFSYARGREAATSAGAASSPRRLPRM